MSYYRRMAYIANPEERPEPPRCIECDECMKCEKTDFFGEPIWECVNPDCECSDKAKIGSADDRPYPA